MSATSNSVLEIFLRYGVPILGLSGAGTTVNWGGSRVFNGFANHHQLTEASSYDIDPNLLQQWGWEIIWGPVGAIMGSAVQTFLFVIAFLGLVYAILLHLLHWPSTIPQTPYERYHHWITLGICCALTLLTLLPTYEYIFAFSFLIFVLFAFLHLYLRATDSRYGPAKFRALYFVSCGALMLVVLLLPTAYGRAYFSPRVWCPAADVDSKTIRVQSNSTVLFFTSPLVEGDLTVGHLMRPNQSSIRELTLMVSTGGTEEYLSPSSSIPLEELLTYEIAERPETAGTGSSITWKSLTQQLLQRPTLDKTHGYNPQ